MSTEARFLNRVDSCVDSQHKQNAAEMALSPTSLRRMEFNDHDGGSDRANLDQPGCWHCSRCNRIFSRVSKFAVLLSGVLQTRVDLLQQNRCVLHLSSLGSVFMYEQEVVFVRMSKNCKCFSRYQEIYFQNFLFIFSQSPFQYIHLAAVFF